MGKVKNLINQKFGKLLVIATVQVAETGRNRWRCSCICDCGNETLVYTSNLTGGKTKSCGCSQNNKGENHGMYKHGYARLTDLGIDPAYKSWSKIKERCYNTNDPNYPLYGKLGITMQDEFITNFEAFLSEIGKYPNDGIKYTVDRIDNDKGYIVGNIRWATLEQQVRNRGKFRNNTTGFTGVAFIKSNGCFYYVATWMEINGKQGSKLFSCKKLGIIPAFTRACEYRTDVIRRLNTEGADYSEKHGK